MSYVKLSLFKLRRSLSESTVSLWPCTEFRSQLGKMLVLLIAELVYPSVMACRNIMHRQIKEEVCIGVES